MCYVTPTPRIKYLEELIRPYRATCKEEDRGDLFKEGTPPEILEYKKEVSQFYSNAVTGKDGRPLM
ncbi:MAG: hypothetical protein IJH82_06205 [Lachnospiraceae bacterium]|nr:hypothetical protein [Lachnospiraceae bacterium]